MHICKLNFAKETVEQTRDHFFAGKSRRNVQIRKCARKSTNRSITIGGSRGFKMHKPTSQLCVLISSSRREEYRGTCSWTKSIGAREEIKSISGVYIGRRRHAERNKNASRPGANGDETCGNGRKVSEQQFLFMEIDVDF